VCSRFYLHVIITPIPWYVQGVSVDYLALYQIINEEKDFDIA